MKLRKMLMGLAAVVGFATAATAELDPMYSNRLSTGTEVVPAGTYGEAIEVPGDGYCATKFTAATKLSNTASGDEITGSYTDIIKKPTGDTDIFAHTLMGWFKIDALPTTEGAAGATTIYAAKSYDGAYGGYKVAVGSDGTIYVGQCNNEGWNSEKGGPIATTEGKIEAGDWFHLAVSVVGRTDGTRKTTATVFFNGEAVETTSGTFGTNLNGNNCSYVRISAGITAAGIYVDKAAIADAADVVTAATTYAKEYVPVQEYGTTVNQDMTWSEIREVLLVDVEEFAENAQITLTMDGEYTITFDTTDALTGGLAFLKIEGACQFALADDLYEDGCWSKTIFSAPLIEAGNPTGVVKDGFNGGWTFGSTAIALRAQNKEVISINIAGGALNKNSGPIDSPTDNLVPSNETYYGLAPVKGETWNNIGKQWKNTRSTVTLEGSIAAAPDGTITNRPSIDLSATATTTWQAGISNPFLRGYLDDGGGAEVAVCGIPYSTYDVIVYVTSDSSSIRLAPITINDTLYTFDENGEVVEGDAVWGVGLCPTPEFGKNAILIPNCTGGQLTIATARHDKPDGRGTVCAVQIVNKGEIKFETHYVGEMVGDVEWTNGADDENLFPLGDAWENGQLSTITITNTAENATFRFAAESYGQQVKFVCEEGCALTIDATSVADFSQFGIFDFTEAAGGVTILLPEESEFDPSTLPTTIKGDWKFSKKGTLVFDGDYPDAKYQTFFTNEVDWAGTVWIKNVAVAGHVFNSYGNANSTLCFTGVKGWFNYSTFETTLPVELVDGDDALALEVTDGSLNRVYAFAKVTGSGSINVSSVHTDPFIVQFKDVSEYTGKITSFDSTTPSGADTKAFPIYIGEIEEGGKLPYGTNSCITVADGATINAGCGWEAADVAFGATLNLKSGAEGDTIVGGVTAEPVYLGTKVTVVDDETVYCLAKSGGDIVIATPVAFTIAECDHATFAVAGAFEVDGSYYAADGAPVKVTYTADAGYAFEGGAKTLVVETEAEESATIEPTEEPAPENGVSARTFDDSSDQTWVVDEGTPWTVTPFGGEEVQTNAAIVGSIVTIAASAAAEVTMNLTNATNYAELRVAGDNAITLLAGEGAVAPMIALKTTVGADLTVDYNAVTFGAITIPDEKTLTFDFSDYPFGSCFTSTTNTITGVVSGDACGIGTVAAIGIPAPTAARTVTFERNDETGCYELRITVDATQPFIYTLGAWTFGGVETTVADVNANTSFPVVMDGGEADAETITVAARTVTVNGGTLKADAAGTGTVTVNGGAFDVNGHESSEYTVVLKGGAYVNNGNAIGNTQKQIKQLTVAEADSTVGGSANFGVIAGGYAANTLDLGGQKLTKTGAATFWLASTTVTNGTFEVEEGTLQVAGDNDTRVTVFAAESSLVLGEGTTLAVARPLTIPAITANGATINNTKSISPFTLAGTAALAGNGTWSTNTLASGAVVDVGTKHDFVFAGAGTVNVTLTQAEYDGELPITLFTPAEGATTAIGDVTYDGKDITSKCTISGNQITAIEKTPPVPSWIDPDDTENVQKYTAWALKSGVTDPNDAIKEAFLFNIPNDESAVELAKEHFVIHSITIDSEGTVKIEPPMPADVGVTSFNGTVILRGSATVDGEYTVEEGDWDETTRFFKAFLELIPAN